MKRLLLSILGMCVFLALLVWPRTTAAYVSYHSPAEQAAGYCFSCHPEFLNGSGSELHDLHEPFFLADRGCGLCHTAQSGHDNPFTLWSMTGKDGGTDLYGCAGCHGRDYGETIGADYRGFEIAGLPKMSGYGLRSHHAKSGVVLCAGCHGESSAGILAEDVAPPYYGRNDLLISDPCADGLDNDGDLLEDSADPDCRAAPVPDISLSPVLCDFPDTEVECTSEPVLVTVSNEGSADLIVSSMTCALGTDFAMDVQGSPDPCGSDAFTLAPGDSCTVAITFCPLAAGDLEDTLTVASDDPDEPSVAVSLTGSGLESSGETPHTGGSSGCAVRGFARDVSLFGGVIWLVLVFFALIGLKYR